MYKSGGTALDLGDAMPHQHVDFISFLVFAGYWLILKGFVWVLLSHTRVGETELGRALGVLA